ncbi:hypothetical protein Calab_2850 [Caldithrix abyssi DSM 13497]|uniref:Uncharacterized protein n=1 Tax=Caldithrix abyssi DSM 13497 TaxID=880073 RepID=H1XRH6_CALAY|nr:hypothetical protein Cabys_1702 [Caldithrix abyssi DSM 13497]EHO42457.1 hypothetical protein Calab_2850 [Caldithrix abyssi DSM 13497]
MGWPGALPRAVVSAVNRGRSVRAPPPLLSEESTLSFHAQLQTPIETFGIYD